MNIENIELGFSTGVLYKTHSTKEALKLMRDSGYETVELGFVKLSGFEDGWFDELTADDLAGFKYVSFHAPKFDYGKNEGTYELFEKIKKIDEMRKLDLVVFHPDTIEDFSVFSEAGFNVSFENMDNRKESHQKPEDFDEIFSQDSKYKMILDVNHVYSNDPLMELAKGFYAKFKDRISQIHLSGYTGYHDPLFQTKQDEIIRAIQDFNIPIIIESVLAPEDLEKERNYVLEVISKI